MRIYILRHGETEWNKVKRLQGVTDIPLDEKGISLASKVGEEMKKEGIAFRACVSSPLQRAKKTAMLVLSETNRHEAGAEAAMDDGQRKSKDAENEGRASGSVRGIPFTTDIRIREVNLGPFEGRCLRDDPRFESAGPMAQVFFHSPAEYKAPEGAESYEAIIERTGEFLQETAKRYADLEGKDFNLLVSTHGCASRALLMNIDPVPLSDYWRDRVPPNCAVSIAELKDGKWVLTEKDHLYASLV